MRVFLLVLNLEGVIQSVKLHTEGPETDYKVMAQGCWYISSSSFCHCRLFVVSRLVVVCSRKCDESRPGFVGAHLSLVRSGAGGLLVSPCLNTVLAWVSQQTLTCDAVLSTESASGCTRGSAW